MATATWISDTSKNWSDGTAWSTAAAPATGDDVVFNGTHVGACTITVTTNVIKSLNMTGYTGNFTVNNGIKLQIGGGTAGDTTFAGGTYTFGSSAAVIWSHTVTGSKITSNGKLLGGTAGTGSLLFNGVGGDWTLQDTLNANGLRLQNGTLNTNGQTVNLAAAGNGFSLLSGTKTLTLGASVINIQGTTINTTPWDAATNGTGFTVNAGTSEIVFQNATSTGRTFAGGSQTYGKLTYTVAGSTGSLTITGSNTFSTINFSDASNARTLTFTDATTTTFTSGFNVNGTASKLMTIANSSITAGHSHTLSYTGAGPIVRSFLSISHSTTTQTNTWFAGDSSTDGGSNTNWLFRDYGNAQLTMMGVGT